MIGQPETIRGFLNAGGDPRELVGWKLLAETVCDRGLDGDQTLRFCKWWLARLEDEGFHVLPPMAMVDTAEVRELELVESIRLCRWEIELLEDESLAARFEAALPFETVVEAHWSADISVRPWSVTLEAQDGAWQCAVTGAEMTGPAVVLFDRAGVMLPVLISPAALAEVLRAERP
jgi:hypothetical protein